MTNYLGKRRKNQRIYRIISVPQTRGLKMGRIKVVHTADLHLGAPCRGLPPSIGGQRLRTICRPWPRFRKYARKSKPICSSLPATCGKSNTSPGRWWILSPISFGGYRRQGGYCSGTADFNHPNSFYREYPWPDNVHIFTNRTCPASGFPISMPGYTVAHGGRSAAGWTGSSLRTARAPRS